MVGCRVNATICRPCGANQLIRIAPGMLVAVLLVFVASCNTGIGNNPADGDAPGSTGNRTLTIDSISPDRTAANFSTRVTIRGGPFKSDTSVLFGDNAADDVVLVSEQAVTVMAPIASVGFVDVAVESGGDRAVSASGFEFTQPAGLQVLTVAPSTGSIDGGTRVTIRGDGFGTDTGVLFGAFAASDIEVFDARLITATTPPHKVGKVDVTILTNGTQQVLANGFKYVTDPVDDGSDADGDGLSDYEETTGYEIVVDYLGFGTDPRLMTRELVTSDPTDPDTDDDGLSDYEEFLARSNPGKADTDGDKLGDYEEVKRWLTSPVSVDTDGDADGPDGGVAPKVALFDGAELFAPDKLLLPAGDTNRTVRPRATSPSLPDTDGDGRTDAEEVDTPGFSPIVAELPELQINPVGEVDIRLNLQFAESEGQTESEAVSLSKSTTTSRGFSSTTKVGSSFTYGTSLTGGFSLLPGAEVTSTFEASLSVEQSFTVSRNSAETSTRTSSETQAKSQARTLTFSDGTMRLAAELTNPSAVTYQIGELSLLVQQPAPVRDLNGYLIGDSFVPVATLRPVAQEIVLAPGETTEPIEFSAANVDGQKIQELLAQSEQITFDAASFDLLTADGLSFDFIRERTQKQTALVEIDFGDGTLQRRFVATNVDRNPDSSFTGVSMRHVMENIFGYPRSDAASGYTEAPGADTLGLSVLQSIHGVANQSVSQVWQVTGHGDGILGHNFSEITLFAGDTIRLTYLLDSDNDGLVDVLETDPPAPDQAPPGATTDDIDGDGLTDLQEVLGWIVFEDPNNPFGDNPPPLGTKVQRGRLEFEYRRVSSHPSLRDADRDGLSDLEESLLRTDPNDADTDKDGLIDGEDPAPTFTAQRLYVNAANPTPGGGTSWTTAIQNLGAVIDVVRAHNENEDPYDDTSQIWVARGTYLPASQGGGFGLPDRCGIYGGFVGPLADYAGETKLGQRDSNPATNGTILSGDLDGDGTFNGNAWNIVYAEDIPNGTRLDGFVVTGADGVTAVAPRVGAIWVVQSKASFANLLVVDNRSDDFAGGAVANLSEVTFDNCAFVRNEGLSAGGMNLLNSLPQYTIRDCVFDQNQANNGGGGLNAGYSRTDVLRTQFTGNTGQGGGGAFVYGIGSDDRTLFDGCTFRHNVADDSAGALYAFQPTSVVNSVIAENIAFSASSGGGIVSSSHLTVANCTIVRNASLYPFGGHGILLDQTADGITDLSVTVDNTVLWQNYCLAQDGSTQPEDDPTWVGNCLLPVSADDLIQISAPGLGGVSDPVVRNSCLYPLGRYQLPNNIGSDPRFNGLGTGDYTLQSGSPLIDRGSNYVEILPFDPGPDLLPSTDILGNPRIEDGNGDGNPLVDIGAYEFQIQDP